MGNVAHLGGAQGDHPPDPAINRARRDLECWTFAGATRVIATTPSAVDLYAERIPALDRERV